MRVQERLMRGGVLNFGGGETGFLGRVGEEVKSVLVDLKGVVSKMLMQP